MPVRGSLVVRVVLPLPPCGATVAPLRPPGGDLAFCGVADEAPLRQPAPDARGRLAARLGVRGEGAGEAEDARQCRRNGDEGEAIPHGGGVTSQRCRKNHMGKK